LKVDSENPIEIATQWLINDSFRKYLHPQVAELIRKYIDVTNLIKSQNKEELPFLYCPLCGTTLQKTPRPFGGDSWKEYLTCANNHKLSDRNGIMFEMALLSNDISDDFFYVRLKRFLEVGLKDNLPDQISELFKKIIEKRNKN
jgi:hypothetical protein